MQTKQMMKNNNHFNSHYLLQALALARERKGFTSPNPAVGAVLVKKILFYLKAFIGRRDPLMPKLKP